MTGKYNHWLAALIAIDAAENISVMDPYNGELITLKRSNNSSSTMPSNVRVYVASSGKTETPTLADYVKNTIQNEVGNLSYPSDALKALCVASASHVQYYKLSKFYDAKGYDIQT